GLLACRAPVQGATVDEGLLESARQGRADPVRARGTSQTGTLRRRAAYCSAAPIRSLDPLEEIHSSCGIVPRELGRSTRRSAAFSMLCPLLWFHHADSDIIDAGESPIAAPGRPG